MFRWLLNTSKDAQQDAKDAQETPQPPWTTYAIAQSPLQLKVLPGIQKEPLVFHFVPVACQWGLLKRA